MACYLGRKGLVDFIFADRTFCSLDQVPIYSMGAWAMWSMKFFTLWKETDSTRDFLFANCYKVIGQDPNDEVISENCSLKTGISQRIVKKLYLNIFYRSKMSLKIGKWKKHSQ